MATPLTDSPRTSRRRRPDIASSSNGLNKDGGATSSPRATSTRKRHRDRLAHDAKDVAEDIVEETRNEGVWLDGPLALTLLPPLGSFLTGGDFIRDGLILALLFYYLRALIKTPWELYLSARARRPPPEMEIEHEEDLEPEHIRAIRALARSELRLAEIAYLGLNLISPFLGVVLLRWGATLLGADASLTWFSTGLFVLATGLRPWRHLIELITARTDSLHDIVHHPIVRPPQTVAAMSDDRFNDVASALDELRAAHEKQTAKQEQALLGVAQAQQAQAREHADALAEAQAQIQAQANAFNTAQQEQRQHLEQLERERDLLAKQSQSHQPTGPTIAEIQAILARVEESVEHLEEQARNAIRATELVRLESSDRFSSLNKTIDGLVKDVREVQTRVATVATTASAASSLASEAMDISHQAQAGAAAASALAGEATASVAAAAARSPNAGRRPSTSLAWTPPPGAGLNPSSWSATSPTSPTGNGAQGFGSSRDVSPSGRPGVIKRRTNQGGGYYDANAANNARDAVAYQVARSKSLLDAALHWSVQFLLVPVKISQGLLHRIIDALGVAAEPTSPRIAKNGDIPMQRSSSFGMTNTARDGVLSPKGKGRAL